MSIPRELSRDTGEGILVSISPDVCLTPVGSTKVPIPYTITAKQADDANTCPTVRATGKRVHTMGSLITTCSGDEPGTAKGIKSGTVGSVCQPKEHSATVNAGGKPVIRHNDVWYMNNGNTVGKLAYVKDTSPSQYTPPVAAMQAAPAVAAASAAKIAAPAAGAAGETAGGAALRWLAGSALGALDAASMIAGAGVAAVLGTLFYPTKMGDGTLSGNGIPIGGTPNMAGGTIPGESAGPEETEGQTAANTAAAAAATAGVTENNARVTSSQKKNKPCKRHVVISRARSPEAAQHIVDAQKQGYPKVLTLDRPGTVLRRAAALRGIPTVPEMDRDEYPPATFLEGGEGASVRYVPVSDNRSAGYQIKQQMNTPTRATEGCKVTITVGP